MPEDAASPLELWHPMQRTLMSGSHSSLRKNSFACASHSEGKVVDPVASGSLLALPLAQPAQTSAANANAIQPQA
jgi:hypothetical protein